MASGVAVAEKPPIKMMKRGRFLAPFSPFDEKLIEEQAGGKPVFVRISQPRNNQRLRLYFAMLRIVCDNLDQNISHDSLHQWVKLKCGIIQPMKMRNGEVVELPGSVAFDKMSEDEFRAFLDKAMTLFAKIVPANVLEREAKAELAE